MEWYWILTIILGSLLVLFILSWLFYNPFFKRFWDIVLSFIAIVVLSPLLLILTIVGAIAMKGNPFFVQKRPGKNEKIFKLIKFRSMSNKKDENGELLPDKDRLGKYGKFLRSTSLDELPELLNVLFGSLSLVGPRPLLIIYLDRYNEEQHHRHDVRPGLTGYAQCHGRNAISWNEKFEMDVWYTKNISLFGDIKIILETALSVLKREGISQDGQATMEEFMGNSK